MNRYGLPKIEDCVNGLFYIAAQHHCDIPSFDGLRVVQAEPNTHIYWLSDDDQVELRNMPVGWLRYGMGYSKKRHTLVYCRIEDREDE